jgi:hypothetical protein
MNETKKTIDELIEVEAYFASFLDHANNRGVLIPLSYRWAHKLVRKEIAKLSSSLMRGVYD